MDVEKARNIMRTLHYRYGIESSEISITDPFVYHVLNMHTCVVVMFYQTTIEVRVFAGMRPAMRWVDAPHDTDDAVMLIHDCIAIVVGERY